MIDLTAAAAAFERALFERGVVAGRTRSDTFVEALCAAHRIDARDLYWLARITLLPSIADLPRFDEAFVAFWTSAEVADRPAEERAQTPLAERESPQTLPSLTRSETADGPRHLASASSEERLRECDFALLDDRERAAAARLFRRLRIAAERSRSRRRRARRAKPSGFGTCGAVQSCAHWSSCATSRARWSPMRERSCATPTSPRWLAPRSAPSGLRPGSPISRRCCASPKATKRSSGPRASCGTSGAERASAPRCTSSTPGTRNRVQPAAQRS